MIALSGTLLLLSVVVGIAGILILSGVRYIPNDRVGLVEKRWSRRGSVKSGLIALHEEAGYQPRVLRGGVHYLAPLQYRVIVMPLVTIPQGKIGYVFARDGAPLGPTQTLASNARAHDFQDVELFLTSGGQQGPQRQILREGRWSSSGSVTSRSSSSRRSTRWSRPTSRTSGRRGRSFS